MTTTDINNLAALCTFTPGAGCNLVQGAIHAPGNSATRDLFFKRFANQGDPRQWAEYASANSNGQAAVVALWQTWGAMGCSAGAP